MHPATFADLGTPPDVAAALHRRGIDTPFPVQTLTIPAGCAGRDVLAEAPTGSGKTIAFGVPLVARLGIAAPREPRGLVLVPTRELATQVRDELDRLGGGRRLRTATIYGGVGFGAQLGALRRGVDVIVACPGRLTDLVDRREVSLAAVEIVVVDEADRMADMGFLPAVRKLVELTPSSRQTLLFSATLDGPIAELWQRYQRDPVRHTVATDPEEAIKAAHHFWSVTRDARAQVCAQIVARTGPTIVFCRTKRGTDNVARKLSRAGVGTAAIHGDRSQGQRDRALRAFTDGHVDALVATDIAARGIHVDDVACVVHWDPPADVATYTHRSGRTARAGAAGVVVSLVAHDQRRDVTPFQRHLGLTTGLGRADVSVLASETPPPRRPPMRREQRGGGGKRGRRARRGGRAMGGSSRGSERVEAV